MVRRKLTEVDEKCERILRICSVPIDTRTIWKRYVEVFGALEELRADESRGVDLRKRDDSIDNFLDWLKRNRAAFDGIEIAYFPGYGFGLRATKNFKRNDLLLSISKDLFFDADSAPPEMNFVRSDEMLQKMPQIMLAIALIVEKQRENSKWKAYLDILPTRYSTIMYMEPDDLRMLKGSPSLEPALRQYISIARQFAYLRKFLLEGRSSFKENLKTHLTYEEYRWAVSTVMTRQNIIPNSDGSRRINCLIPLWDLCNHGEGEITTFFNMDSNRCECYAMTDFKAGEQIFIYYGPRTNSEFFAYSGFVHPNNREDNYKIHLGISKYDKLQDKKVELLKRIGLHPTNDFHLKARRDCIPRSLLDFLRVFCMTERELDYSLRIRAIRDIKEECSIKCPGVDERVITFLSQRLKLILESYDSTLDGGTPMRSKIFAANRDLVFQMVSTEVDILQQSLSVIESARFQSAMRGTGRMSDKFDILQRTVDQDESLICDAYCLPDDDAEQQFVEGSPY